MSWLRRIENHGHGAGAGHTARSLEAERLRSARVWGLVRLGAVAFIAVWAWFENPWSGFLFYLPFLIWFAFAGLLVWKALEAGFWWSSFLLAVVDAAVLTVMISIPNPGLEAPFPIQARMRLGNEMYYYLIVAQAVFAYAPGLIVWTGAVCGAAWTAVNYYASTLPGSVGVGTMAEWEAIPPEDRLAFFFQPTYTAWTFGLRTGIPMLIVSLVLAAFVRQAIRLVFDEAESARERANLARYFPPAMVDRLASMDTPFGQGRRQDAAVMFADVVGFTRYAEPLGEDVVLGDLRELHARIAEVVFRHGGTLDKYLGDGVMVTFGTPEPSADDALRALECAAGLIRELDGWNTEREGAGRAPLKLSVGVHFGSVVTGSVGGEARLEYAVLGDVVNVASRLEAETRELEARIVVSDNLVSAARTADGERCDKGLDGFARRDGHRLRGRDAPIDIWCGGTAGP